MVPTKLYTIGAAMIALVVALAGCASEESTGGESGTDLDPGAGEAPFDDTNDNLTSDDETLGDEQTTEDNMTSDTNMTGDTNSTTTA